MNRKTLSIIVPSYNMEAYLQKCLGSLLVDDRALLEKLDVIVVNDGSKDRTSEIAHSFEARFPGVFRVIDKANGHYGSCINAALPVAEGEYVKVLDADDSVDTQGLVRLLEAIDEELARGDRAADLVATDYVEVNPDGEVLSRPWFGFNESMTTLDEQEAGGTRLTIHAICYRTRNLRRIGYRQMEGVPYTDTEWIIEPTITVRRFRYVPAVTTRYLVGRDGQTMDPKELSRNFQVVLDITRGLLERHGGNIAICEEGSRTYYNNQITGMLRLCYGWGLLGYHGVKMQGDMAGFDKALSSHSDFYRISGEFAGLPNHFPFMYVKCFRKHGYGLWWRLRAGFNAILCRLAKII